MALHVARNDSNELFFSTVRRPLADILQKLDQRHCSIIIFTDAHLPDSTIFKVRRSSWCTTIMLISQNVNFLDAFAEWSDKGFLMEWETRLLVITSVPSQDVKPFLGAHWAFSMMNSLLVNVPTKSPYVACDIISYLPYSTTGSKVVKLASWRENTGMSSIRSGVQLFPEKYNNFYGSEMNMTVFPFTPYWMTVEQDVHDKGPVQTLTGRDYIMLEVMAKALNFTINVLPEGEWDFVGLRTTYQLTASRSVTNNISVNGFTFSYEQHIS
ncbi:uncharacterized protein [Palaemon carinicauda]|uniref:uncharacterized protein n=1 Tax=Palaemon carinicauda TaxID=392227 RepID=UPI0035B644F6